MNISKFTQKSIQAINQLEKVAYDFGNQEIEQEHLLYSLLHQEDSLILKLVEKMEINKEHFLNRLEDFIGKRVKVSGGQPYVGQYLNKAVSRAIGRYYEVNMHPGCVKRGAPNFDPLANVDDGSCTDGQHANFSFGGVFQECEAITGPEGGRLCKPYTILNPLTGQTSCPANYTASLLSSEVKVWSERSYQCWPQCQSCWLIFTCCHRMCGNLEIQRVVRVNASWCAPSGATPTAAPGLLFGGLYSPGRPNPRTGAQACPSSFFPLTLLGDLKVCVSSDWELGVAHAVPFGGFFSCQVGNPLAAQARGQGSEFLKDFL